MRRMERFARCRKMLCVIALFGLVGAAPPLVLTAPKQLAPQLDAFPRIASPLTPKTLHINTLLAAADRRATAAAAECKAETGSDGTDQNSYVRTVHVAMRGTVFLAYTASDDTYCGGAYPNALVLALTYDLTTGAPVNWARYLPKSIIDSTTVEPYDDDTDIGEIGSAALTPLFFKDLDAGQDPTDNCETRLQDENISFMIWPDAGDGGLDIYDPDVPHAAQGCAGPVTITMAQLKALGVSQRTLDAIGGK